MEQPVDPNLFIQLNSICQKMEEKAQRANRNNNYLKEIYDEIKKLPSYPCGVGAPFHGNKQTTVSRILCSLLQVISKCDCTVNDLLLGGTCIVAFLYKVMGPEYSALSTMKLISFFGNTWNRPRNSFLVEPVLQKISLDDNLEHLVNDCFCFTSDLHDQLYEIQTFESLQIFPPIYAIVHGILSCHKLELLLHKFRYNCKDTRFFRLTLDLIIKLCTHPGDLYFHAFQLLLSWMKLAIEIICSSQIKPDYNKTNGMVYFSSDSYIVKNTLKVLEANWECPINGIPEYVRNVYKALFEAHSKELLIATATDSLFPMLLKKTMKLSWKTKGKYIVLTSLLYHADLETFFQSYPNAPADMMSSIKAKYIASILSEVYKTMILKLNEHSETAYQTWERWWLEPILNALASNDKQLFLNIRNYILPVTLKLMPDSYFNLIERLKTRKVNDMAEVVLLRIAKDHGVYKSKPQELYNDLQSKLHHNSECVRIEVLTTLCSTAKKSEPVDAFCLELVKEFLVVNLNIDSSAFNQSLMAQLKALLIRIRDSLAKFTKRFEMIDLKQIEFIEWLVETALNNTFPGACYQRRRTCLQILNLVFDTFLIALRVKRRKEQPSANINKLISQAQERGYWMFFKDSSLFLVFPCLSDFTDDVRSMGADLLQSFFPWPNSDITNGTLPINIQVLLQSSLSLCSCSHLRYIDSGSLICRILFSQYALNQGKKLSHKDLSFSSQSFESYEACIDFLFYLTEVAESQLSNAEKDFLTAASNGPVHGMLNAIQRCISLEDVLSNAVKGYNFEIVEKLVQRLIELCKKTVSYMLALMGSDESNETAPSFEDIGRSLQDQLACKNSKIAEGNEEFDYNSETAFNTCALSPEFQLLLSCCWHSIKNSCFLLSELVVPILNFRTSVDKIKTFLCQISVTLSSALLKCRHRGVIEACSTALNKFCKCLLSSEFELDDIPFQLLKNGLDALSDSVSTSVTRRSAGLSLLIQAVVSGEIDSQKGTLVSFTVEKLLAIMKQPLCMPFDQTRDLPQVSAYHILKTLVSDAGFSAKIFLWIENIFPICISGFSSASWAIRNAALQLFGALLPRMCGQKKIRDDESEHNLVSPAELFMRCRNLYSLLLQRFRSSISNHSEKQLHPELVPLLCLIAKLSPEENNDINRNYVKDFKSLLVTLLESRLWRVRDMASSALSAIFRANHDSLEELSVLLNSTMDSSDLNVNKMNGILLTICKSLSHNKSIQDWNSVIDTLVLHSDFIVKVVSLQNINSSLFLDILSKLTLHGEHSELHSLKENVKMNLLDSEFKGSPWNYHYMLSVLQWCDPAESADLILNIFYMNQNCTKACLDFMYKLLETNSGIQTETTVTVDVLYWKKVLRFIVESLEDITEPIILCDILNFVITLCSRMDLAVQILDFEFTCNLERCVRKLHNEVQGLSISAHTLTVASFCMRSFFYQKQFQSLNSRLEFWIRKFFDFSHPRRPEILKMQAARFISIAGSSIFKFLSVQLLQQPALGVALLICLYDGSLMLLEDEDEEVRQLASLFTSSLPHQYQVQTIHHSTGILVLCNLMTDLLASNDTFMHHLWSCLQNFPSTAKILHSLKLKNRKMNLFEQEYVNVYSEPVTLSFIYFAQLKMILQRLQKTNFTLWVEKMQMFAADTECEIIDASTMLRLYMKEISDVLFMEYVSQPAVYLALFKLNCASEIICKQAKLEPVPIQLEECVIRIENKIEDLKKSISVLANWISFDWHFSSNFNIISLLQINGV